MPEAVSLLDLVDVVGGGTPSRSEPRYWGGDIPWVTVKDLSDAAISDTAERITEEGLENSAANLVPAGAIVLATRIAPGRAALTQFDLAINQDLKGLIPRAGVDALYLFHFIRSNALRIARMGAGSTVSGITLESLGRVRLLLPNLTEQRRVAVMLDKADAVQRNQRERMRLLDELVRSAFLEMLGDPVKHLGIRGLPAGWKSTSVASIATHAINACAGGPFGSSLTRADYVPTAGVPVIRGANLIADRAVFREENFVFVTDEKAEELRRNVALPGDIVFTQRGTLGQVARIPLNAKYPRYIISQSQMKVTLDETVVDPVYFVHYFLSQRARTDLEARTLATGVPHINLSILRGFPLLLPPLALQRRFAALASRVDACRQHMEAASFDTDKLASSLADLAFGSSQSTLPDPLAVAQ